MAKKNFTRRQFMATMAAGTGTVLIGNAIDAFPSKSKSRIFDPFQIVTLGKTGIKTTLLGMGTGFSGYNRSSNITRAGVAESIIRAAYEKGIRFFDCADSYGTHPFTNSRTERHSQGKLYIEHKNVGNCGRDSGKGKA